jgi:hypothetical protein
MVVSAHSAAPVTFSEALAPAPDKAVAAFEESLLAALPTGACTPSKGGDTVFLFFFPPCLWYSSRNRASQTLQVWPLLSKAVRS